MRDQGMPPQTFIGEFFDRVYPDEYIDEKIPAMVFKQGNRASQQKAGGGMSIPPPAFDVLLAAQNSTPSRAGIPWAKGWRWQRISVL